MFLFKLVIFIKLHVMWLIWTHVIFFWEDHENKILMQSTEIKKTFIYSIKRARVVMRSISPTPKFIKEREPKFISLSVCNRGEFLMESKETK